MLKKFGYMLLSLLVVFKHLFKRPVTLEYPEKKQEVGEKFRGKPEVTACIKCGTCLKVCPSGAITISDNEFIIDMKKCIFCGNCAFYCPKSAIKMSKNYELATNNKEQLKLVYQIDEKKGEENERA